MSPIRVLSLAASTAILFTACSNDADRVVVASNESTFVSILNEGDKIEKCTDENEGATYFVSDSSAFLRCNSGKWTTLTVNYTDTIYSIDSIFIRDTVQGLDGKNGKSCSAKDTVSSAGVKGYNLDCGSERIGTIWNGRDGLSAYEIAVQNGYEGSEEDWIHQITTPNESSSSESSSSEESSSSSSKENWDYLNPDKTYELFTDPRDSQVYKTIQIGTQTWFAENLNYKMLSTYCYDGEEDACKIYGRLYPHGQAKTACPDGWHLPSKDEVMTMYSAAGNNYNNILSKHHGGSNSSGFSLLYAGARNASGNYRLLDSDAYLWTSSYGSEAPYAIGPFVVGNNFYASSGSSAANAFSVRCVKD